MTIQSDCIRDVHAELSDNLTRDQVKSVVETLADLAARDPDNVANKFLKYKKAAKALTEAEVLQAKREKISRARNILARKGIDARVEAAEASGGKGSSELYNMTVGSIGGRERAGDSIDANAHAIAADWTGGLEVDLRKAGVLDDLTSRGLLDNKNPQFEENLVKDMSALTGGADKPSGDVKAAAAAKVLNKWAENARQAQNAVGAFIGKAKGYISAQTHDRTKIATAGGKTGTEARDYWKQKITQRLDPTTFDGIADPNDMLDQAWTNLATGNHSKEAAQPTGSFPYTGPGNLANRISQQRVFIFKSGEDWLAYNREFGVGTVLDGMLHNMERAARNVALMKVFGTNPEAMFNSVVDSLITKAKKAGDLQEVAALESGKKTQAGLTPSLLADFQAASGQANIPGNPTVAERAQMVRNLQSMTKLGGVVLSSFPDIAVRASTLRHNGVNLIEGMGNGIKSLFVGRGSGETRDATNLLVGMFEGSRDSLLTRFSAGDSVAGVGSKLASKFFKLTGLTWWQDSMMGGMGRMLSVNLARRFEQPFEALDRKLQVNLGRYGINAAEWDAIRATPAQMMDGTDYVFAQNYEGDIRNKLQNYFVDQAREGMTMPGAAERAWITQFGPPGSLAGEAARFTMQFKTYSITMARRHFGREIRRDGFDGMGISYLILGTTLMGYGSMVAKDLAKGRTPRDPTDPSVWAAAMAQGGGAGIYGDFLLGQYNRFGSGLAETLAGPAVGTVADAARIFAQVRDGGIGEAFNPGRVASNAIKFGVNNTPFANLFYTRAALDYLFLYHVQEWLDPGSLKRMEQNVQRNNNQEFLLKPSSVAG